ncbi:MAG: MBL fold metallo-hydrolase [Blastocatellia bacterium]|nr:MAG: MBL fold metallo-hydrolase [Blastocatellia bacterium]
MTRHVALAVACVLGLTVAPSAQNDAVKSAADALGAGNMKSLQFSGSGANFSVGQNYTPSDPWPRVTVKSYTASVNYDTGSMRQELVREMGTTMPRGGGAPFTGEQRQVQVVSGNYAWNVAPAQGGGAPQAAPAPANAVERMLTLWATPQGFVKAAMANNATTKKGKDGTEVSFMVGGKYKMTGIINAQNQVDRVQTWIDQPIVGDMLVETIYSDYKDFGGVRFPSHIVQRQDGFPSLDLTIASVTANAAVDITVPDNVRTAQAPPVRVESAKLADGVYYLTGGTHHSLAVEMKDHIVLVDTPQNEPRALAVIAKAKELIPNKPIRYVVTSHHHWDHLGGIRTAMDEGATIVTHQTNKSFLERVAKTPHTINPDRLAASKKPLKIQTVGAKGTLTDGTRIIELHLLTNYEHTGDMLVVYLPKEKILAEPDAFTPPATASTPLVVTAVPYAAALYDNIQRLKLDVQTIAPFHGGRTTDVAELAKSAGKGAAAD